MSPALTGRLAKIVKAERKSKRSLTLSTASAEGKLVFTMQMLGKGRMQYGLCRGASYLGSHSETT